MERKYYSLVLTGNSADITIYGDITSFPWLEGDTSAATLSAQLDRLNDVSEINVYINSYGGEVAEGLAIYNALKRHKAKVKTYCDGFACSIASVIFMAGDERIMNDSSLLMIHNAWTSASGNADQLRKAADDVDKITQASIVAYLAHTNLTEKELKKMLDAETWLLPEEAVEYGFATGIEATTFEHASQNAKMRVLDIIKQHREDHKEEEEKEAEDTETDEEPETDEDSEKDEGEPEEPDEEPTADDGDEDEEEPEEKTEAEEAAQKWSGFFNALIKL